MHKRVLAAALVLSIPAALSWSQENEQKEEPVAPVFKGEASLVYCFPGTLMVGEFAAPPKGFQPGGERASRSFLEAGLTLLHVSLKTHQAKVLRTTGAEVTSTTDQTAAGRRHTVQTETRCVGVTTGGAYLYVAVWQVRKHETSPNTSELDRGTGTTCLMEVYDLTTGEMIGRAELNAERGKGPTAALPAKAPEETPSHGVLSQADGKVSLFGATFAVVDGKLKWSDAPKADAPTTRQAAGAR